MKAARKSIITASLLSDFILLSCIFLTLALLSVLLPDRLRAEEKLIDIVVASVNDQPITLSDLSNHLRPVRKLTFAEAAEDPEARLVLDQLITERLIEAEAQSRKISVGESDIAAYMGEVAQRNGMSQTELESALKEEHIDISQYRDTIKLDILKSRLAGIILRDGVSVTEKEVQEYIDLHPELVKSGVTLKLRQIVVKFSSDESEAKADETIESIESRLRDGEQFAKLAHELSESPDAADGGLLGLVPQEDLSPAISAALASVKEGEHSEPIKSSDAVRLFYVEERFQKDTSESMEKLKDEVRKSLEQEKTDGRLATYFTVDLLKKHSVDKKI